MIVQPFFLKHRQCSLLHSIGNTLPLSGSFIRSLTTCVNVASQLRLAYLEYMSVSKDMSALYLGFEVLGNQEQCPQPKEVYFPYTHLLSLSPNMIQYCHLDRVVVRGHPILASWHVQ